MSPEHPLPAERIATDRLPDAGAVHEGLEEIVLGVLQHTGNAVHLWGEGQELLVRLLKALTQSCSIQTIVSEGRRTC